MISLKIPKTFELTPGENTLRIRLATNGKTFPLKLDMDGDERAEDFYYTEPIFIDNTTSLSYVVEVKKHISLPSLQVVGLDTEAHTLHMSMGRDIAQAENSSIRIMSRSEWGADETLRYTDSPIWQKTYEKMAKEKDVPKSEASLRYEEKIKRIRTHLATNFRDQDMVIETKSRENEHVLVWPIEKTKQVERIVIHHTAENNQSNRDDLALIRGIYYYHTIVRGWGDIGYNYLVGQRGQIYEGRAGGDYNVAAHALWNNKSSV